MLQRDVDVEVAAGCQTVGLNRWSVDTVLVVQPDPVVLQLPCVAASPQILLNKGKNSNDKKPLRWFSDSPRQLLLLYSCLQRASYNWEVFN